MRTLILGGARSGKSALAERLACESGQAVVYIATAQAHDEEMAARIAHHRDRRPAHWQSVEEPLALADTLRAYARPDRCVLVDCLTLWLSNLLGNADDKRLGRCGHVHVWAKHEGSRNGNGYRDVGCRSVGRRDRGCDAGRSGRADRNDGNHVFARERRQRIRYTRDCHGLYRKH